MRLEGVIGSCKLRRGGEFGGRFCGRWIVFLVEFKFPSQKLSQIN